MPEARGAAGDRNLTNIVNTETRIEEILAREKHLLSVGFSQQWIDKVKGYRRTLFTIEAVNDCIGNLKKHGFKDPHKMIETFPTILSYSPENIDAKLQGLTERGFKDPRKMVELYPAILSYGFENIDTKLEGLETRGFKTPHKLIESSPAILGYSFENIDAKLQGLTERGFKDPRKMVELYPNILTYSFENIDGKIAGLTSRGFKDPSKMIESSPAILGYSFENIDKKLKILKRLFGLYKIPLNATDIAEEQLSSIMGTKTDKLWVLARICEKYLKNANDVTPDLINKLIYLSLENLLIALQTEPAVQTMEELLMRANRLKKQKISKKDRRERVISGSHKEIVQIYQRYLRDYPLNEEEEKSAAAPVPPSPPPNPKF